jgi:hypothetical protein
VIHDAACLREVIEEIAEWDLQARRDYLAAMRKVFGPEAEQQLKEALTTFWKDRQP